MPRKSQNTSMERSRDGQRVVVEQVSFLNRVRTVMADKRTPVIVGLVMLTIALVLTIAFVSYFFVGDADQSLLRMSGAERSEARLEVHNALGLPGAWLAETLVNGTFGLLAFWYIALLICFGMRGLGVRIWSGWRLMTMALFSTLWGCVMLGFVQYLAGIDSFFCWGGICGRWASYEMNSYIQPIGMIILLTISLVIFLILFDSHFIDRCIYAWSWMMDRLRHAPKEEVVEQPAEEPEAAAPVELDLLVEKENESAEQETPEEPEITIEIESPEQDLVVEEPVKEEVVVEKTDEPVAVEQTIEAVAGEEVELLKDDPEYVLKTQGPFDPRKDLENYQFPSLSLLKVYDNETQPVVNQEEQQTNANRIVTTLRNYGIEIESIKATVGPTVTLYEVVPKTGTRINKIQALENDIMMSLAATGIRIIAPIPGKSAVGIEVPNEKPQTVSMHSVIASKRFQEEQKMRLPIAIGRTITNEVFMFDLAKTPHLLVAGATGQGKSVAINAIITSLLYKKHPAEMKLVMVDPKMVEFAPYKPLIRHYLAAMPDVDPDQVVITECDRVINTLNSLVIEMENRYKLLMDAGVRNLEDYNEKFINRRLNPAKVVGDNLHHQYLPYIVIIIDEYGDFIMQAGKQVETPIARITQKARAVGMHMILATQRPSVNIVTGVIKANIPTRIALRTQSVIDSRTVLDVKGAEQLIGRGDMLYAGNGNVTRIQCAFVDTPEVDQIVDHISGQQHYFEPYQLPEYVGEGAEEALAPGSVDMKKLDPMFADVARYVVAKQEGSTSRLQRAFEIGYNRAGKLSDQLEAAGIVGPNKGPKGRDVLIQDMTALEELLAQLNA